MSQVDRFLTLVNQRYFDNSDSKRLELDELWKSFEKKDNIVCSFVLTRGKNKGNPCKKPCHGNDMCKLHTKQEELTSTCTVLLKSGGICGRPCTGNRCSFHPVKEKKLVVRQCGDIYLVKGTKVIFCMDTQTVLGYKDKKRIVYEENYQVKQVCNDYKLTFKQQL